VLIRQSEATLGRVAQAAAQQRAQARARGLNPHGWLAAATRWHVAQERNRAAIPYSGEVIISLGTPEAAAIAATEVLIREGGADLLTVLETQPHVASVLINRTTLRIPYRFRGKQRQYIPDALVRLSAERSTVAPPDAREPVALEALLAGEDPTAATRSDADDEAALAAVLRGAVFVVLEIRRSRDVRDQAQAEAAERWCAAMTATGTWGHRVYLVCPTVEELPMRLDALIAAHLRGV